jgi:hypothetical protein
MAHQESLSQWIETVSIQMKDLAPHHATIMALWSFGMVIAQSCGITSVAEDLPMTHIARRRPTERSRPRLLSCFRRGVLVILTRLIAGKALPPGRFLPEPWPQETPMARLIPLGSHKEMKAAA